MSPTPKKFLIMDILTPDICFQVQPYLEERRFGAAYDCVYFFTAPIWSGLFVCTIFSIIMIFGLVMIMDIKTMDMFDDPKGKTITINVSE
jgi:V-type H+-transporting ATPase S1 subunit